MGILCLLLLKLLAADASAQQFGGSFGDEDDEESLNMPAAPVTPSAPAASASQASPAGPAIGNTQQIQTWGKNAAGEPQGKFVLPDEDEENAAVSESETGNELSPRVVTPRNQTPQTDRPTLDGSVRGRTSMRPILSTGEDEEADISEDEFIFLYITDFKIDGLMAGMVNCDVTFVILSTLNTKVNSISFTISWPDLSTPVRYENIAPNTETIQKYTLLGKGCYNMDQVPTIRIHTCRVKGLTQEQCKDRVKWVTRQEQ